jgi:hypothetical protein
VAGKVAVSFAGEGSGRGELSWGQQTVWRSVEARGAPMILSGVEPVPAGKTVADVAAELGFLMSRHQSLRTRLVHGDDGGMSQVVAGSGETSVEIIDVDDDADPREAADTLEKSYETAQRDYANDWPIEITVIRHRGVPVYQVLAVDHMSTDGFGTDVMASDLVGRDTVTGCAKGPVTAMPPLEQAAWQGSDAGRRQSDRAVRYWENLLRNMPRDRFPPSRDKRSPRYWEVRYKSRAAYLASQLIAARLEVDTTPVMLAAVSVAAARVSGINPVVPRLMVSNRFRSRFAESVSPIAQTCPCAVDVAGVTFDEAVRQAKRSSIAAYKYAYFEPVRIRETLAAVGAERGEDLDVDFVVNDRRGPRAVTGPLPTAREVRAAVSRTTLEWADPTDNHMDVCHLHLVGSPDVLDVLEVLVLFDSHYVSPGDMETLLRTVEEIMVEAAGT